MALRTVDLVYRRRDWRIREDIRDGSSVRPAEDYVACRECGKKIREATRYLRTPGPVRFHNYCLTDAVRLGLLVEMSPTAKPWAAEGRETAVTVR